MKVFLKRFFREKDLEVYSSETKAAFSERERERERETENNSVFKTKNISLN